MIVTAPLGGDMGMMGEAVEGVVGLGRATASAVLREAGAPTARVIGSYPAYLQVGEAIGAKVFNIPMKVWNAMSKEAQWAANQKFLDRGIRQGAEFVLATHPSEIRAGTTLAQEVNYLLSKGYTWSSNGLSLVPK